MTASDTKNDEKRMHPTSFYVVAGTYERLLYGLTGNLSKSENQESSSDNVAKENSEATSTSATLEPVFIYPAHINCIKSLAATPKYLATGSTDEQVKIYDLRERREVGTLMHHSGTITALAFYRDSHLLTGAEDGTVAIVRTSDWEVLKRLRCGSAAAARNSGVEPSTSTAAITGMAMHPSGKVLLTVSRDGSLRCWDLTRAVCAFTLRHRIPSERVAWSPKGTHYALMTASSVAVHSAASANSDQTEADASNSSESASAPAAGRIECGRSRFNAIAFTELDVDGKFDDGVVVCGAEDRTITVASIDGTIIMKWASEHGARIKDVSALVVPSTATDSSETHCMRTLIATCSSDGGIFVWDLAECYQSLVASAKPDDQAASGTKASAAPPKIAHYDAKCRLTCVTLTLVDPKAQQIANARAAAAAAAAQAAAYATEASDSEYEDMSAKSGSRVTVTFENSSNNGSKPKPTTKSKSQSGDGNNESSVQHPRKKQRKQGQHPMKRNKQPFKNKVHKATRQD